MRITIEIDEKQVRQIQKLTKQRKMSPAINLALSNYLRQQAKDQFLQEALSGQTDFALTNEELEQRDVYEAR
jgi:hypothetical protein